MTGILTASDCFGRLHRAEIPAGLPHTELRIATARGNNFFADLFARHRNDELLRAGPVLLVQSAPKEVYKKILVATDFSEKSREAARLSLRLFPSAQLVFLHAFHGPNEDSLHQAGIAGICCGMINSHRVRAHEAAKMDLNRFVDDLGPRRQLISCVVQYGFPLAVICNYAKRMGADLIVIGKHGKPRLKELLHGSLARRLISQTSCDLLVASAPSDDFETISGESDFLVTDQTNHESDPR